MSNQKDIAYSKAFINRLVECVDEGADVIISSSTEIETNMGFACEKIGGKPWITVISECGEDEPQEVTITGNAYERLKKIIKEFENYENK